MTLCIHYLSCLPQFLKFLGNTIVRYIDTRKCWSNLYSYQLPNTYNSYFVIKFTGDHVDISQCRKKSRRCLPISRTLCWHVQYFFVWYPKYTSPQLILIQLKSNLLYHTEKNVCAVPTDGVFCFKLFVIWLYYITYLITLPKIHHQNLYLYNKIPVD
jgi:hypothetical protein